MLGELLFGTASVIGGFLAIAFIVPQLVTEFLGLTGIIDSVCYNLMFLGAVFLIRYLANRNKTVPYLKVVSDDALEKVPRVTNNRVKTVIGIISAGIISVILVMIFSAKLATIYNPLCVTLFIGFICVINYFENTWREEDAKNQQIE